MCIVVILQHLIIVSSILFYPDVGHTVLSSSDIRIDCRMERFQTYVQS